MPSFGKLILLLLVGVVVLFGLRAFKSITERATRRSGSPPAKRTDTATDLTRCAHCGVFYDPRDPHRCSPS
jgi:hypothetical protein